MAHLRSALVFFLVISFSTCFSQSFLRGKIIELNTESAIPHANLSLGKIGTASLEDGTFILKIDSDHQKLNLTVSCIGYHSRRLSMDSLLKLGEKPVTILMTPFMFALEEVSVQAKKVTPREMVREAINAIPQNYRQEPFNMEFYSRVSVHDGANTSFSFLMEAIVKSYRKGYYEGALNKSKMIHQRTTGQPVLTSYDKKRKINYFWYESLPMFDLFVVDMIGVGSKLKYTIFNESYFKKLEFKLTGISLFESDRVFVIEYNKGKMNEDSDEAFSGRLYLSVTDLGILKHERRIGKNYHEVIYKKQNGNYFPYFIKSVYPDGKKKDAYTLKVVHESIITKVITEQVEEIAFGPTDWHLDDVPYSKSFWEANYPLQN
jgi:hypothetical protein